jgi:purine-binding chemotaxis protein CheW
VTPLPKAPALIDGVIDLRGAVVPVIDLGRALGGDPISVTSRTRIAVAEVEGLILGLAVDAAIEVLPIDVTAMEDPPGLATQAGYDATRAVVRRPDADPILVLSLEHVLESIYRSSLPAKEITQ